MSLDFSDENTTYFLRPLHDGGKYTHSCCGETCPKMDKYECVQIIPAENLLIERDVKDGM